MKRNAEAISHIQRALEVDPLSSSINANAGVTYMSAGDYKRAELQLRSAIEIDPRGPMALGYLGRLYERGGNHDSALEAFQKAEDLETEKNTYEYSVASVYARSGRTVEAQKLKSQLIAYSRSHWTNPYSLLIMYSGFGDEQKVLSLLDKSIQEHSCTALEVQTDYNLDFVRHTPEFEQITRKMNLPAY